MESLMRYQPPLLHGAVGLDWWIPLKAPDILGRDEARVIPKGNCGTVRPRNDMRRCYSLNIDEIQANTAPADSIGLPTVKTSAQSLIAL